MPWSVSMLIVLAGAPSISLSSEGLSEPARKRIEDSINLAVTEIAGTEPGAELRVRALGGATRVMISLERLGHSGMTLARQELYLGPSLEDLEQRLATALRQLWPTEPEPRATGVAASASPETPPLTPILLASGGGVAIIAGMVLAAHSSALGSEMATLPLVDQNFRDLDAERRLTAGLGYGLLVGGASALVAAVLLEVFDR